MVASVRLLQGVLDCAELGLRELAGNLPPVETQVAARGD